MKRSREVITTQDLIALKQTGIIRFSELARQAGIPEQQLITYTYPHNRMKFHKNLERNERLRRVLIELKKIIEKAVGDY